MNNIEWRRKAVKQLRKIASSQQRSIVQAVERLTAFPNCQGIKAMVNHDYSYRLRVGQYRVFFEHAAAIKIITIEEVKKRDERTY